MSESSHGPGFHPLYQQVKELMIQRVLAGDWKPGELLPSEMKLAVEYHVSQGTARKALEEMVADHLVVRHQGKGTFVTARASGSPVHFFSIVNRDGQRVVPGPPNAFDWSECAPNERERRDLNLKPVDRVYRIFRVRPVDGVPALIERISVQCSRFPGLPEMMRSADRMNTYVIMEREFGILVVRAREWVEAIPASEVDVAELGVSRGSPILAMTRVSLALDGTPVETRRVRFSSEKFRYFNDRS